MHCLRCFTESNMKLAILFEVGGHLAEYIIFGLITPIEVAYNTTLLGVQILQIFQRFELLDWILQLFLDKLQERLGRSLAPILPLAQLSIAHDLQCGIFANMETGSNGRLTITIHFA